MATMRDDHWTFGDRCYIKFPGGGVPVNTGPQAFATEEGCASISDGAGALLFYTDGRRLYDSSHTIVPPTPASTPLGGFTTSCQSAIIIPPVAGGSWYHVFTVDSWEPVTRPQRAVTHWAVVASGASVAFASQPVQLTPAPGGPIRAAERLAAVQHRDCSKFWVVALYMDGAYGVFHAIRVDGDAKPTVEVTSPYPTLPNWVPIQQYSMKFSPDGSLLAVAARGTIDIMSFDRTTGAITPHSQVTGCTGQRRVYGLEFSPNGKYLYFSCHLSGDVRRHTIGASGSTSTFGASDPIDQWGPAWPWPTNPNNYRIGALQIAPNGKIYGARYSVPFLFEIGLPDSATTAANATQFKATAETTGHVDLNLNARCRLGLPNFARMTRDCDDRCSRIAGEVDDQLYEQGEGLHNQMIPCADTGIPGLPPGSGPYGSQAPHGPPACTPLALPEIRPWIAIRWGDSACDCIEGDDTEIMYLKVCNPYSNLTLSNLTIHKLEVVDKDGKPPEPLPDGSPSIQLVPIGPYCFDDLPPCSCVTRQFVLKLRGAKGGRYEILIHGICFDACVHGDVDDCFAFEVCKD